jgi:hypothetical protein
MKRGGSKAASDIPFSVAFDNPISSQRRAACPSCEEGGERAIVITPETALAFGAGFSPRGIMRGRFAIPVHDRSGRLLAYCGRTVKDPCASLSERLQPASVIFNAHRITKGEPYLVRDPLQVLQAFESGIENVVAFLTDGICPQQFEELSSLTDQRKCDIAQLD